MARLARLVVPDLPHHVTQRGNRKQDVFFGVHDYSAYRALVAEACERTAVSCLAWCLMPNHLHLILTPPSPEGLRKALGEAHRRYSRRVNEAHGWTGFLFQGRFASFVMDPAHLMVAVRYVELNPVRAGLAERAEDWPWSSARAHISGRGDGLTDQSGLAGIVRDWRAMLEQGLEAGDCSADEAIEAHSRTGRPWGDEAFLERLEATTGRSLRPRRPGRKPRR
ncbi:MAG TPA: transposase [Allosphingosinicella sp.]|nr:transposase [Allosphingosinicella sp.]